MIRAWYAALLAASVCALGAPVASGIAAVALCAGPHNAVVLRYALARLPARPGPLASYVALGAGGAALLAAGYAALALAARSLPDGALPIRFALSTWLSLVVTWIAALAWLRAHQAPRRAWGDAAPLAVLALGACWHEPAYASLALVYLHPIVALAVLDRELARTRRADLPAYRRSLGLLALSAALVALAHAAAPDGGALARHAGAPLFPGLPPLSLVGVHTLLELAHYAVWLIAIPRLALGPIPLERRARHAVRFALTLGGAMVVALWVGFALDAVLTRDIYFVLATGHVLAEVPLLLRLL